MPDDDGCAYDGIRAPRGRPEASSRKGIELGDDGDAAVDILGGDDPVMLSDRNDKGSHHETLREAEGVTASDCDVGEHVGAPLRAGGFVPLDWRPMCPAGGRDHFFGWRPKKP